MQKLPLAFFSAAALCAVCGMVWGIIMAASNDHGMMPAHAHLNLMGWATLALMGTYYAISGRSGRLGWINFWISAASVVITIPGIAMVLSNKPNGEAVASVGSLLALAGMLVFLANLVSAWRAPAATA